MSADSTSKGSPLDAAKRIVAELDAMTPETQSLALKFAIEVLGLKFPAAFSPQTPFLAGAPPSSHEPGPGGADHSTDIKSFTALKSPKSDQQFTAVVAYYYLFKAKSEERKDTIDDETVRDAARLAGWPQVSRWQMTLTNAKNAGYLDGLGGGKFKLSSVGENLVAITLPDGGGPASKTSKKTKKVVKKKSKAKNPKA